MQIKCLVENNSIGENFIAEHGLSLLIYVKGKKILFDMGQGDVFLKNAKMLDENLEDVDFAIISHGHYDHGGGLENFLKINKKAPVYIHKQGFRHHFNGNKKYIGLNENLKNSDRIKFVDGDFILDENIKILTLNSKDEIFKVDSFGLNKEINGAFKEDDFVHEIYLEIVEENKKYLFSGCSHKGIKNIVTKFNPHYLIGGFHFKKVDVKSESGRKFLFDSAKYLNKFNTKYITCHCTGNEQYKYLKNFMKENLSYICAGMVINI